MNHTITDTTDTNILTAEEFLRQARRWATASREFLQVREPAPAHPPLHGGLVRRTHRTQRGTPLRPRR
jgi:hypothetical protein